MRKKTRIDNVLARRVALGWSQARLAREAGIAISTISRLETGANIPSLITQFKIDTALVKGENRGSKNHR